MSDVVYQPDRVLDIAMEIGVNLLKCGAEISRVENTISYNVNEGQNTITFWSLSTST